LLPRGAHKPSGFVVWTFHIGVSELLLDSAHGFFLADTVGHLNLAAQNVDVLLRFALYLVR
jgi:hypothetical protein